MVYLTGKREQNKKSDSAPPPHPTPPPLLVRKKNKTKKSSDACTCLGATQVSRPYKDSRLVDEANGCRFAIFSASVCDSNFPSLVASLFSWRCLAASTSSFLHAAMNLHSPSVAVSTHTLASNPVVFQSPVMPNALKLYRVYRDTHLRTDDVHCRKSAGTGPIVLKVIQ